MILRDYISKYKKRVTTFATEIGVTRDCVYKYMNGDRIPEKEVMPSIVRVTKGEVTANDFHDLPILRKKRSRRTKSV